MIRVLALLAMLAAAPAAGEQQPIEAAHPIIDTGAHPCDGQTRWWVWRNPQPIPLLVVKAQQWFGATLLQADIDLASWVADANGVIYSLLLWQQADFYAGRNTPQTLSQDFPGGFTLPVGGHIYLRTVCSLIAPSQTEERIHGSLTIYYRGVR
jgi:hypothetical protein